MSAWEMLSTTLVGDAMTVTGVVWPQVGFSVADGWQCIRDTGSLALWLGRQPEHPVAASTALALATQAFRQADEGPVSQRVAVAVVIPAPGQGSGPSDDTRVTLTAVQTAQLSGIVRMAAPSFAPNRTPLMWLRTVLMQLQADDASKHAVIEQAVALAEPALQAVWLGERPYASSRPGTRWAMVYDVPPVGILCGSFNPLHDGHRRLRTAAERVLGGPTCYELSVVNADKPPLDYLSIDRRRRQFVDCPLLLTGAATFAEKAAVLPGTTFVVGYDTAERIVQPRFYGGDAMRMAAALDAVREHRCRFLVAGRLTTAGFRELADISLPSDWADLFQPLSADEFREDVSSTELRALSEPEP